jgi:putative NIF3 family GTP cyclohydrolase 1 type 2
MKIKEVAETLERFAPLPLQESYDNAGLQIGLTAGENVSGVLLCLDVTEEVITEAEQLGCNLIVSHHPLLFRPLRHVTLQTQVERCVVMAIQKGIAIYSAHTNLDNAPLRQSRGHFRDQSSGGNSSRLLGKRLPVG